MSTTVLDRNKHVQPTKPHNSRYQPAKGMPRKLIKSNTSLKGVFKLGASKMQNTITVDERIMGGTPVISGSRVSVYTILDYLAEGYSLEDILKEFLSITAESVKVALKFAASLTAVAE